MTQLIGMGCFQSEFCLFLCFCGVIGSVTILLYSSIICRCTSAFSHSVWSNGYMPVHAFFSSFFSFLKLFARAMLGYGGWRDQWKARLGCEKMSRASGLTLLSHTKSRQKPVPKPHTSPSVNGNARPPPSSLEMYSSSGGRDFKVDPCMAHLPTCTPSLASSAN